MKKITLFFIVIIISFNSWAGGSAVGNGGDWFVRKLPLLRIQLPEEFGVVEGVQYKRVGLRLCNSEEIARLEQVSNIPDKFNIIYLPDRNWNVYKVILENSKYLLCSLGLADNNPSTKLETLLNNEDTNRILYYEDSKQEKQIKYSKSRGLEVKDFNLESSLGTFLSLLNDIYIGYNLQDGFRVLGSPSSIYFKNELNPVHFVYIPLSIQDRNRVYFIQTVIDNSKSPTWRIVLPVAFNSKDLPLADLSKALRNSNNSGVYKSFMGIKLSPSKDLEIEKSIAWSSFNKTPTSTRLRYDMMQKFGVNNLAAFYYPDQLQPKISIQYVPSIIDGKLNHAAFQHDEQGSKIILPIVTQAWRIGADIVHELTHLLQEPCYGSCTDDRIFEMEMEAHINERKHLKEMEEQFPMSKYANDSFNYLVAASIVNVEWSDKMQKPIEKKLCEDVIDGYKLDFKKISNETLLKFKCIDKTKIIKPNSRRNL